MTHDTHTPAPANARGKPPLVVDLDGTLVRSDLLWEALALFLKLHTLQAWKLPFWLLRGKAEFKRRLAEAVAPDPATLPYDSELIEHLENERRRGRTLVLATGAERRFAEGVAAHLKLFSHVHATDGTTNLTAHSKARHLVDVYGDRGFDYVGDSRADRPVWLRSRLAYSVTRRPYRLADGRATEQLGSVRAGSLMALFKGMRPRQWLKNLLVFVPMLAAHRFDAATFGASAMAFLLFSMCASSAYLLNDTLDAGDDRQHPSKCRRPVASGTLQIRTAVCASLLLAVFALATAAWTDPYLLLAVMAYFASTLWYSLYLKRLLMVDIITLSVLYSMRILGGAAAVRIEPSFWLLAFSFFIFLSLALLKRHSELFNLHAQGKEKPHGRGYVTGDRLPVAIMGINSAFMSVLVFILYFESDNVRAMYGRPQFLFAIVPLLVFWLGRLWTLSFRGQVNEDPVLYVSRDRASLCVIALCGVLAALAAT